MSLHLRQKQGNDLQFDATVTASEDGNTLTEVGVNPAGKITLAFDRREDEAADKQHHLVGEDKLSIIGAAILDRLSRPPGFAEIPVEPLERHLTGSRHREILTDWLLFLHPRGALRREPCRP